MDGQGYLLTSTGLRRGSKLTSVEGLQYLGLVLPCFCHYFHFGDPLHLDININDAKGKLVCQGLKLVNQR